MIEVKVPKEIRAYREKLFFGLNLRQTICGVLAIVLNIPIYIYLRPVIGDDLAAWIIICIAAPFFFIGFFQYNGMPFEQFALCIIRFQLLAPRKRKYKSENLYDILMEAHHKKIAMERKRRASPFYKFTRRFNKRRKLKKYLELKSTRR